MDLLLRPHGRGREQPTATPQNVTLHLKAIYAEGEVVERATCKERLQVQKGGARQISLSRKFCTLSAILAADYDPKAEEPPEFFSIAQNKLHFAVSALTPGLNGIQGR